MAALGHAGKGAKVFTSHSTGDYTNPVPGIKQKTLVFGDLLPRKRGLPAPKGAVLMVPDRLASGSPNSPALSPVS